MPTLDNPADLCSKGINAHETQKFHLLHRGPSWLEQDEAAWPPRFPDNKKKNDGEAAESDDTLEEGNLACLSYSIIPSEFDLNEELEETFVAPFHLLSFTAHENDDEEEASHP